MCIVLTPISSNPKIGILGSVIRQKQRFGSEFWYKTLVYKNVSSSSLYAVEVS